MSLDKGSERLNAASLFIDRHIDEGRKDLPAILCGDHTISYGELYDSVNRFGNIFLNLDIRMEERVAILLPDIPEFAFAFFGAIKIGAVALPLNALLTPDEYEFLFNDSRARVVVVHISLLESVLSVRGKLRYLEHIIVCGGDVEGLLSLEVLVKEASPYLDAAETNKDDSALWLYSSGTTGFPKGIVHRHHSMALVAEQYAKQTLDLDETDISFSVPKLFFAFGLGNGLFFPLWTGGTCVLLPEKPMVESIFHTIDQHQPTIFYSVPTNYAAMLQAAKREGRDTLGNIRICISGGEPLPKPLFEEWKERFGVEILEIIGTSESLSIFLSNRPGKARIGSVGQLVPGYDAKIVDDMGDEVPTGEIGSLLIRGESITPGYWHRYGQTKKSMLGEWYDTGDKFYVDEDEYYYYVGRNDDMMRLAGEWVAPNMIETIIQKHPSVLETGVVGITDEQGLSIPVAHIVLKDNYSPSSKLAMEIQDFVRINSIPHNYVCWVEFHQELPRTSTGKIQRIKLRQMERNGDDRESIALVEKLRKIESQEEQKKILIDLLRTQIGMVFEIKDICAIPGDMSFFDLGMDSMSSVVLRNHLRLVLGRLFSPTLLFQYHTLNKLSEHLLGEILNLNDGEKQIDNMMGTYGQVMPQLTSYPEQRFDSFPLTDIQMAYLLGRGDTFELGNVATHWYVEIDCPFSNAELSHFNDAWQSLIERQDMLRVVIEADGTQRLQKEVPYYHIVIHDLIGLPEKSVQTTLADIRDRMSHEVLDAHSWPIFKIEASRLDSRLARIHISLDLLVMDAWSMFLIFKDLYNIMYNPEKIGSLGLTFRDYVLAEKAFQDTEYYKRARDYWFNRLDDLPSAPDLPLVMKPAELKQHQFTHRGFTLSAEAWSRLQECAAVANLTPSTLLLTVFTEILSIWSKSSHFIINVTMFNRLPVHPEINDIVGDFTSLLLLEVDNSNIVPFVQRANKIQQQLLEDLDNNAINGVRVLRELARRQGGNRSAVMPVVFSSTLGLSALGADMSSVSKFGEIAYSVSQTPQVYLDHQLYENNGELILNWDCVEEMFPEGLLDDMFGAYRRLLELLATDETAWERTSFNDLLMSDQLIQRAEVNDTAGNVSTKLLHEFFIEQAVRQPDAIAVIAPDRTLSYGELLELAKRTAHWLQRHDVTANTLVGVVMEKGWEQIVAVLGTLMAGGAYLPVDAYQPAARRNELLKDGKAYLALTQPKFETHEWSDDIERLIITEEILSQEEASVAEITTRPEDLAYVLYTSGSTGRPKGVMLPHRGPVNTILDVNRRFNVTATDRTMCLSALNFDLSVYDIFGLLAAGGALVIPAHEHLRDPGYWRTLMSEHRVTLWNSVPAMNQMLVDFLESSGQLVPADMRIVMMSGDWIPLDLPERIRGQWPEITIVGMGGPTEASIWNNHYVIDHVDPDWKSIPYGKPLANQYFQVLDVNLEPRPVWVPGELYIGGLGLANGYWGDKERTDESFIIHPRTGERLYKSGDLARYLPDGNLEILGRSDFQVKIRGHRIELKEIEGVLSSHPGVKEAVVTAVGDEHRLQALDAYIVPVDVGQSGKEDFTPGDEKGVILDPAKRLEFKLNLPGLRPDIGDAVEISMAEPDTDESLWLVRQSYREFHSSRISSESFGQFLSCLKSIELKESPLPKYRYPSAGSLYPVQCYLYIKPDRIEGIEGGIYYYHPVRHSLVQLSSEDDIGERFFPGNTAIYRQSSFGIFLIGNQSAIDPMYANWARDFSLLEAGHIGQLLMEVAPEYDIGLCPIGAPDPSYTKTMLGMEGHHILLYGFLGGGIEVKQTRTLMRKAETVVSVIDELKHYVSDKLPEYMVPDNFTLLDSLPLTPNGKLDRNALPSPKEPIESVISKVIPPDTDLERKLVDIWAGLLSQNNIGIYDNFFDVGGNSLLIVRLQSKIREDLGTEVPVTKLFQYTTIHDLAKFLGEQSCVENIISNKAAKRHSRRDLANQRKQTRQKHRITE